MKFSWRSIKISIAGAKLTHLVRKDKIWDHGTMVETVKIIFNHVQKARNDGDLQMVKKYMTTAGCEQFKKEMAELRLKSRGWPVKNPVIREIGIIEVAQGRHNKPDHFTAVVEEVDVVNTGSMQDKKQVHEFSEQWQFVRQGDWWLLDSIKFNKQFLANREVYANH